MNRPNESVQLVHPDAETLNAFVEHLLRDDDRQQILAHTAECSRCRQILYYAQEAAEGEPAVESAPAVVFVPAAATPKQARSWFSDWRFAAASAAASAALIAVSVFLYQRHAGQTQLAAKVQTAERRSVEIPSADAQSTPQSSRKRSIVPQPAPAPELKSPSATPVPEPRPATAGARLAVPEPAMAAQANIALAPQGSQQVTVSAASAPLAESTNQTVSVVADNRVLEIQAAPITTTIDSAQINQLPLKNRDASKLSKVAPGAVASGAATRSQGYSRQAALSFPAKLPNGETAVSTAAASHNVVAVDKSGALFLSSDGGRSWESVTPQWTGRIVTVRVPAKSLDIPNASTTEANASDKKSEDVSLPKSAPPASFEIVNDTGAVWASTDGKTWIPR